MRRPPYTAAGWDDLTERVFTFAERRTRDAGSLAVREALREFHIDFVTFSQVRARLVTAGRILDLGKGLGLAVPGVVPPVLSLESLLRVAGEATAEGFRGKVGRRALDAATPPAQFSPSQLTKIRTAVSYVSSLRDSESDAAWLRPPFRRDALSGRWELLARLEQLPTFLARTSATRAAHRGALKSLLDFAEARGLLGTDHETPRPFVEAAEWVQWITESLRVIDPPKNNRERMLTGLRLIARIATARGWLSVENVDWAALLDAADSYHTQRAITRVGRRSLRLAYRALRSHALITGPADGRPEAAGLCLVPSATIRRAVFDFDYENWRTRDGVSLEPLASDLHMHHRWRSQKISDATLRSDFPMLPPRAFGRGRGGRAPFLAAESTWNRMLQCLLYYAGWLVNEGTCDSEDLRLEDLTSTVYWDVFVEAQIEAKNLHPTSGRSSSLTLHAQCLAILAHPYLSRIAEAGGDPGRAAEFERRGAYFRTEADRLKPGREDQYSAKDKIIAWETDNTPAYLKLLRLRDLLSADIVQFANGASISSQLEQLRRGSVETNDPSRWAVAVRDAAMISVLRRVPLRAHNLVGLEFGHTESQRLKSGSSNARCEWSVPDAARPWDGAITFRFPSRVTKAGNCTELPLITADACGIDDFEADLGRNFIELYLRPNGARSALLAAEEDADDCHRVFVPDAGKAKKKGDRPVGSWTTVGVSQRFTDLLFRFHERLGMQWSRLDAVGGATGIHVIRHLFGSWFYEQGDRQYASAMLMHTSPRTLDRHYAFLSPRALSYDRQRGPAVAA